MSEESRSSIRNLVGGLASRLARKLEQQTTLVLKNFDSTDGSTPRDTLIQHTNGRFYGETLSGGREGWGVFYSLEANLRPFVSLLPYAGKVGKTIGFLGQGFTGATTVSFNGTAASPVVKSSSYLTATVPAGATSGFVTVAASAGTLTSNKKFLVTPQVTGFTPSSGTAGTVVTITGVSLTQATRVSFGGVAAATVTVRSDTQVTATVPSSANTGKISVTTSGGTATSSTNFTVN